MSTVVTYNGITFHNVLTKQCEEEAVFDPSGTDFLYQKTALTIQGYIHAFRKRSVDDPEFYGPRVTPNEGENAAEMYKLLHHRLLEPRKDFVMLSGVEHINDLERVDYGAPVPNSGTTLFEAHPATGSAQPHDLANGPFPRKLALTKVIGAHCFWAQWTIEFAVRGCYSSVGGHVLSNRWTTSDVRDRNGYTTRQFDGKLILSTASVNPHSFRGLCVPVLQPGMQREKIVFVSSEDGLTLAYSVTDREVSWAAPKPATSFSMQHSIALKDGSVSSGYCSVRLEGPRDARHDELIQIALRLVESRVARNPVVDVLRELQVTTHFGDTQVVEVRAEVLHNTRANEDFDRMLVRIGTDVGRPIRGDNPELRDYDRRVSIDHGTAGAIGVTGAITAKLQTACDSNPHGICDVGLEAKDLGYSLGSECFKTSLEGYEVPAGYELPNPVLSDEQQKAPYTHYRATAKYSIKSGQIAMPVARHANGGGESYSSSSGDVSPVCLVQVRPDVAYMSLRISGERVGAPVGLPKPSKFVDSPTGITYHALSHRIWPESVNLTADGKQIFRVEAEYEFVLSRVPTESEQLRTPNVPWLESPQRSIPVASGPEA